MSLDVQLPYQFQHQSLLLVNSLLPLSDAVFFSRAQYAAPWCGYFKR